MLFHPANGHISFFYLPQKFNLRTVTYGSALSNICNFLHRIDSFYICRVLTISSPYCYLCISEFAVGKNIVMISSLITIFRYFTSKDFKW